MIGYMISRIRNDKNVAKSELSRRTNINIGHISHIEKEERNPSHRALKSICRALEVPYQPLMYTYDKVFTEEQKNLNMENHISINDKSMEPRLEEGSYAFVEFNSPLDNKDIGIFEYDNKVIIRRYVIRKDTLVLRADNKEFSDIVLNPDDDYTIIGKIIGTSTGLIF